MAKRRATAPAVNFVTLAVRSPDDADLIQVVIETPKGSRNKYAFDPDQRVFHLKKVLPSGMAFPYDFGFVPSTKAQDGDPLDVLVLMDEAAFPGCIVACRVIGAILGEQDEDGETVENHRLIAVENENHNYSTVKRLSDLGKSLLKELEQFFVDYHALSKEKFRVEKCVGRRRALALIQRAKGRSAKSATR
jgi:inorganic pyrophosphatase